MKITSLSGVNPHAQHKQTPGADLPRILKLAELLSVSESWEKCRGSAVADDSKHILSVNLAEERYTMADIRLIRNGGCADGRICLELFFDGDTDSLKARAGNGFEDFMEAIRMTITGGVQEYFRRNLMSLVEHNTDKGDFRKLKFPDVSVSVVGETIQDGFRDAGCMLSFIAARVSVSEDCAKAIGGIAFPEYFGMKDPASEADVPIPKWLVGMGVATVVAGVATVYAWMNILIYGNSLS